MQCNFFYEILPCLQLEIGFDMVEHETLLKAQTCSTILTPELCFFSLSTCLAANYRSQEYCVMGYNAM
jgi:hypothetical protein